MFFFFGALPIDQSKVKHTKKLKEIPSRYVLNIARIANAVQVTTSARSTDTAAEIVLISVVLISAPPYSTYD